MKNGSERYVCLAGGFAAPLPPVLLVLDLEARCFTLRRDGNYLFVKPRERLTACDRAALRRWRHHVLAVLDYVHSVPQ